MNPIIEESDFPQRKPKKEEKVYRFVLRYDDPAGKQARLKELLQASGKGGGRAEKYSVPKDQQKSIKIKVQVKPNMTYKQQIKIVK